MVDLVNAAPMVFDQGIDDLSERQVPDSPLQIPQHLPKFYIFAEKGPTDPIYVDLNSVSITSLYGDATFDITKKFYTHSTKFLQKIVEAGNNCVVHRVVPPTTKGFANVTLSLDVLPIDVPVYDKNPDGSIMLVGGVPSVKLVGGVPVSTPGYNVFWVASIDSATTFSNPSPGFNTATSVGTQTGGSNVGGLSTRYPIFKFSVSTVGTYGNTIGVRLYPAMRGDSLVFSSTLLNTASNYTYFFQLIKTSPVNGYKVIGVKNKYQVNETRFVLKSGQRDVSTGSVVDMKTVLGDAYITSSAAYNTNDLGNVEVSYTNLDLVLEQFYQAERAVIDTNVVNRDQVINSAYSNHYCMNIATFCSSNRSPYQAIKEVSPSGSNAIKLNSRTNIFMNGGYDGSLYADQHNLTANTALDAAVQTDLVNYEDPANSYKDLVMNPESIIWDTGYSPATKLMIMKFISLRKDTFVALSTYSYAAGANNLLLQEHLSYGQILKTAIELYPESSTFGTPVTRGIIVAGSGQLIGDPYRERVPMSLELAIKAATYMGASNGKWKNGFAFDHAPGSVVRHINNIDVTWVPASIRNEMWDSGINFVLNYSKRQQFFPAVKTVYNDDTSVLNSFFTVIAISYLNKIEHAAWREFTGAMSMTPAQLEENVNDFVSKAAKDHFDNKFVIVPACTVTALDDLQGFSWTLPVKIYANNMRTVMTTYVEAHRMSDLTA